MRASRLVALHALPRCRCSLRHGVSVGRLAGVRWWLVSQLARDRSRITGLPAVVAGLLSAVVPTTFAWSAVASAVLCPAMVGRRGLLRLRLAMPSSRRAVIALRATGFPSRLHRLLLQLGGVHELLETSLLLAEFLPMQAS
jgi:hypothetical protein